MVRLIKHMTLILFLFLLANTILADKQKLSLELSLDKETYLLREPVWLDVTLKNISDDTVRIKRFGTPCHGLFNIELKDAKGSIIPFTGGTYNMKWGPGWLSESKNQYYDCYNITSLFNTHESLLGQIFGLLPVGEYSIKAHYGDTYSNDLTFRVIEPFGQEQEAYKILVDAFDLRSKKKNDSANQKFHDVKEKYPQSAYAEKGLDQIICSQIIHSGLTISELQTPQEMLNAYPNTGYSNNCLALLVWEKTKEEQKELLQKIIEKAPPSRTTKFAKQRLRMLEKESEKSSKEE